MDIYRYGDSTGNKLRGVILDNGGSKTVGEAASFTMAATGTEDIQFTNTSTVAPPVTGRNIQNNSWIMMLIVVLLIGIGSMVFFRKVKRKYH